MAEKEGLRSYVALLLSTVNVFSEKSACTGMLTIVFIWGFVSSVQYSAFSVQQLPQGVGLAYDLEFHNQTFISCLAPGGCVVNDVPIQLNEQTQLDNLTAPVHILAYYDENTTHLLEVAALIAGDTLALPTSKLGRESNITLYRVELQGDIWKYTTVDRTLDIDCDACISFWLTFSPISNVIFSTQAIDWLMVFGKAVSYTLGNYVICFLITWTRKKQRSIQRASMPL